MYIRRGGMRTYRWSHDRDFLTVNARSRRVTRSVLDRRVQERASLLWHVRRGAGGGIAGVISGLGVPLLYVAFLNRHGPGTICTTSHNGGQSCVDELNAWPWFAFGLVLVALGAVVFVASGSRRQRVRNGP
jgi:hypothetical protein